MKNPTHILLIIFCFLAVSLKSQYAPVTTAGSITNAAAPGSVIVPVTVTNFVSIGAFTLTLRYKSSKVTYVSAASHPSFPGMTITQTISGSTGKLVITWPETPGGVTLPDQSHLLDLTFTYISGTSFLSWGYSNDLVCQYEKYSGGSYIILDDTPKASYYINGGISNRGAPVTIAPVISNPVSGSSVSVPVTVNNFTDIGAMSLKLEYDSTVLTYQGYTANAAFGGVSTGIQAGTGGTKVFTIGWYGPSKTFSDGSNLFTLNFIYQNVPGYKNYTALSWQENGPSCEYSDAAGNVLIDIPTAGYYKNGMIYPQLAPMVWLPVVNAAVPSGSLSAPVFVNNFSDISSFTLSFEYDPAVMTYGSFTPDAEFGSDLAAADSPSGSKRKIVMSWSGSTSKTLPDGSLMATVNFTYISGTSPLAWMVSDETSCRFNDAGGSAFYDLPKSTHYQDGIVASHVAPQAATWNATATAGQQVTVPVNVFHFTDIGLFSFTLDYDPAVLTYQSATLVPAIGGTFTASTAGLGRIVMDWSGTATSLADSSDLVNLTFTYNGGASTLAWFDDGNSCRYAESTTGPSLYDLPRSNYYINGYVGPSPLAADFMASPPSRDYDTTITLIDMTTGGPTSWNWSISPSTYYFVNGTSASTQNPHVKFTSNGIYSVTLIVSRGTSSSIRIRTDYMFIGTPGLWTGITSSDWGIASNWHNFKVPAGSTGITIPETAPFWPHITGDLVIGALCEHITMQGAAQLYVDGDLTINTGSSLTFTGSGTLFLGGDWLNQGVFNCGTGNIEFTGPNDATIFEGVSPETFYKVVVSKNNSKLKINGTVNIVGTDTQP